jgi:hypothetical protein
VIEKSDSFLVEAAGGEQKLAARKHVCPERDEASNNRRTAARCGVVSLPEASRTCVMGAGEYEVWRSWMAM